ncbi:MAG: arsenic resistance N-acetyltransferase ArsN2 [Candidatus Marinarcus sp.]|uniref:arsenic resistance N-acetyltransferase ArsN2 n=1 Tax=Candidatus Marinarcus sp. TaxID=3100987 RepID=UPI003B00F271
MEQIAYSQEVRDLLVACDLPVADLLDNGDVCFFGFRQESELLGVIGVEVRGDYGLLRSLAISAAHRGNGLGQKLVRFSEEWATRFNLKALYLLTTTANGFFEKLGYEKLPRSKAPSAIIETQQFLSLCPDSSIFMGKGLGANQVLH